MKIAAGNGGSGAITFHRDRLTKYGAPDGGDGGSGGSIYFKAIEHIKDLSIFKKYQIIGNNGKNGSRKLFHGKPGGDIYYNVPMGTLIYEIQNHCFVHC